MPLLKGLKWTFNTVASTYEKLRSGYVRGIVSNDAGFRESDASYDLQRGIQSREAGYVRWCEKSVDKQIDKDDFE